MDKSAVRCVVIDTETTGLNKLTRSSYNVPTQFNSRGSEVMQIGGLFLDKNMEPLKAFCFYCDTVLGESLDEVKKVHNIDITAVREIVRGKFLEEIICSYLTELLNDDMIFIGCNTNYDMNMIGQTVSNSTIDWTWEEFTGNLIPKRGRYAIDIFRYIYKQGERWKRLSSFEGELKSDINNFISMYSGKFGVETNCLTLLKESWSKAHNSLYDSIMTYLLWRNKVWKNKLV